jgi:hypothetical protein
MNFQNALLQTLRTTALAYKAGDIPVETMRARAERLNDMRRRSGILERTKVSLRTEVQRLIRARDRSSAALAAGETLATFDVGYTDDGPMEEVGITVLSQKGIRTTNYIVWGFEARWHGIPHRFGDTVMMAADELRALAQETFDAAGLAVFHAAHVDLSKLGLSTGETYYADTASIARLWQPDTPSLDDLCAHYGIDNEGWHNSGNDSRRTLEVLMSQCMDKRPIRPHFA